MSSATSFGGRFIGFVGIARPYAARNCSPDSVTASHATPGHRALIASSNAVPTPARRECSITHS